MSCEAGPRIIDDGLVFYYDKANTEKSWKGAPTTNVVDVNLDNWDKDISVVTDTGRLLDGQPIYSVTFPLGTLPRIRYDFSYAINDTFTTSINYRFVSGQASGEAMPHLDLRETGFGTTYGTVAFTTDTDWHYTDLTYEFTAAGTGSCMMLLYRSDSGTAVDVVMEFSMGQCEKQTFATPFVDGTRSNTQALLDITGNNTLTATDLTYAAGNEFSFDGTDDEMHPNINWSYLNSSALEVVFYSTNHTGTRRTIFGYRHNENYSNPTIGSLFIDSDGDLKASVITDLETYRIAVAATSPAEDTFYHVILNKNTATGLLEIFINGVSSGSITFDADTYGYWSGGYIGADILDIGKSTNNTGGQGWAADFLEGTIPVCKVYNRILTAAEAKQNFEAIRSRFGI